MRTVTQPRAVATRHSVLLAAAEVFEKQGYAAATISEILCVSGVTKGALYFHFDSKDQLAQAIIQEQSSWRESLDNLAVGPVQRLIDLSYAFTRALEYDPLVRASIRLTLERGTFNVEERSDAYDGWIEMCAQLLREAAELGQLQPGVDPEDAAHVVTSSVTGTQLVAEATTRRKDLQQRMQALWPILLRGMVEPAVRESLDVLRLDMAPVPRK